MGRLKREIVTGLVGGGGGVIVTGAGAALGSLLGPVGTVVGGGIGGVFGAKFVKTLVEKPNLIGFKVKGGNIAQLEAEKKRLQLVLLRR